MPPCPKPVLTPCPILTHDPQHIQSILETNVWNVKVKIAVILSKIIFLCAKNTCTSSIRLAAVVFVSFYIYLTFLHFFSCASLIQVCFCGWTREWSEQFFIGCARFVSLTKRKENKEAKKGSGDRLIFNMLLIAVQSFKMNAWKHWEELITQSYYLLLKPSLKII